MLSKEMLENVITEFKDNSELTPQCVVPLRLWVSEIELDLIWSSNYAFGGNTFNSIILLLYKK